MRIASALVIAVVLGACGGASVTPAPAPARPPAFRHDGIPDLDTCERCHTGPHAGAIESKRRCAQCHSPTFRAWKVVSFDHTEATRLDLGPAHRKLACAACHTASLGTTAPPAACEACHANRSPHQDRWQALGSPPPCGMCHGPSRPYDPASPSKWPWSSSRFDHLEHGGWALVGKHGAIGCRDCHRGRGPTDFERLKPHADCMGCHEHAAVHRDATHPNGMYSNAQCRQCHRN